MELQEKCEAVLPRCTLTGKFQPFKAEQLLSKIPKNKQTHQWVIQLYITSSSASLTWALHSTSIRKLTDSWFYWHVFSSKPACSWRRFESFCREGLPDLLHSSSDHISNRQTFDFCPVHKSSFRWMMVPWNLCIILFICPSITKPAEGAIPEMVSRSKQQLCRSEEKDKKTSVMSVMGIQYINPSFWRELWQWQLKKLRITRKYLA